MKVNVWNTILQLSKERGVEPRIIIQAIEESLRVASARFFIHGEDIQVLFRPERGELRVYVSKKAVLHPKNPARELSLEEARGIRPGANPGDEVEVDLPADTLGRISAQAAKQVIFQKVRDAEQEKIYGQFAPRLGEIITGVVRRFENTVIILEVNKTDIVFPLREKLFNEEFQRGDSVKAVIVQVLRGFRGPQIIVSRANAQFLAKLLELEIPEIANGTIEIRDIVRQPGERAKVAVESKERDIDPIGACIGVKGNRILAVSKELAGEKIDIIEWNPSPILYAKAALSPAKVENVLIQDTADKVLLASVSGDQLSLAIGKKGINVKLASRLVGWKISIQEEQRT
ncbi:MAG: transcription termination factor NusA [Candidatus Aminicenantes bacterium]|nr:transcription termination factor NusA [Candidatus Aminicenantes bacterium]